MSLMRQRDIPVEDAHVLILGVTFKENCPDVRNTKVADIYDSFRKHTSSISVVDVWADPEHVKSVYGITVVNTPLPDLRGRYDVVILAVAHHEFLNYDLRTLLKDPRRGSSMTSRVCCRPAWPTAASDP